MKTITQNKKMLCDFNPPLYHRLPKQYFLSSRPQAIVEPTAVSNIHAKSQSSSAPTAFLFSSPSTHVALVPRHTRLKLKKGRERHEETIAYNIFACLS